MKKIVLLIIVFTGLISSCRIHYSGTATQATFYEPGTKVFTASDSVILLQINPYQKELDKIMNEVLVHADTVLEKGKPESTLGNFVADACWEAAAGKYNSGNGSGIDFCVLNNGGLRSSLPAGAITLRNVFELMPFENELVVLTLSGNSVAKLLEFISKSGGVPVSKLEMKITGGAFSEVYIGGKPFDASATYRLVTSDYLANGGDAMAMLGENLISEPLGIKVRDAIIADMRMVNSQGATLKAVLDGRISK